MNEIEFEIEEIEWFSGRQAHIYSIRLKGSPTTLIEDFFNENRQYAKELKQLAINLKSMGETGCRRDFFKHNEGNPGDGVAVLKIPKGRLRLYCLYFDRTAVIFGSGGYKPQDVRAYQEVPELNAKAEQMKKIASIINQRIIDKIYRIDEDGILTIDDEELI